MADGYRTIPEAAKELRVHENTIRNYIARRVRGHSSPRIRVPIAESGLKTWKTSNDDPIRAERRRCIGSDFVEAYPSGAAVEGGSSVHGSWKSDVPHIRYGYLRAIIVEFGTQQNSLIKPGGSI